MGLHYAEIVIGSGTLKMAGNVLGIKEGGMVNGAMSRKVEITLNSAVSLVQTLQPLLFIPCYKSGCGELRGVTRRSRNAFELQLAYNSLIVEITPNDNRNKINNF